MKRFEFTKIKSAATLVCLDCMDKNFEDVFPIIINLISIANLLYIPLFVGSIYIYIHVRWTSIATSAMFLRSKSDGI